MPSIINALSTGVGGLVQTADASGVLQLQSNGTTALTVDTAQKTTINNLSATAYSPATSLLTSGTAQNTTSGTSIDFTGIPSWVKRITVMFNGVSTNGTSLIQVQIGSGSFTTSGYLSSVTQQGGSNQVVGFTSTTGFLTGGGGAGTNNFYALFSIVFVSGNTYLCAVSGGYGTSANFSASGGGNVTLSGTLDRVRITTTNGTDTFDAGSVNILYE